MSKAYTMKEMKGIVEFLVEHNAYGEIKGRKMWMDFSDSQLTHRTWQSLKETFVKRILPDIHNPYYKLTMDQIRSFRQGCDVALKDKNKLDFTADCNKEVQKKCPEPTTNDKGKTGENKQCSKVHTSHRPSVEALDIDHYKTIEDIQKDLETSDEAIENNGNGKDICPVQLPTTSALHESINKISTDDTVISLEIEISDSETNNISPPNEKSQLKTQNSNVSLPSEKNKLLTPENINDTQITQNIDISHNSEMNQGEKYNEFISDSTVDSILPNNQQALGYKLKHRNTPIEKYVINSPLKTKALNKSVSKKRSISVDFVRKPGKRMKTWVHRGGSIENNLINFTNKATIDTKDVVEGQNKRGNGEVGKNDSESVYTKKQPDENVSSTVIEAEIPQETIIHTDCPQSILNPRLKSVDLCKEQVSAETNSYLETNDNNAAAANHSNTKENTHKNATKVSHIDVKKVVLLNSDSENDIEVIPVNENFNAITSKKNKDTALCNLFGFSSGAVSSTRKKTVKVRECSSSQKCPQDHVSSESSECASINEDEYTSPAHVYQHVKPKSYRIYTHGDGSMFAFIDKRMYPMTVNGNVVKNYTWKSADADTEETERNCEEFWKTKYLEQKKRADKAVRQLQEIKERNNRQNTLLSKQQHQQTKDNNCAESTSTVHLNTKQDTNDNYLKMVYVRNNEELQMEGQWPVINLVFSKMLETIRGPETLAQQKPPPQETKPSDNSQTGCNNVIIIPNDQETSEDLEIANKTLEIEKSIFKDIEEAAKTEQNEQSAEKSSDAQDSNVTRRRKPRTSRGVSEAVTPTKAETSTRPRRTPKTLKRIEEETSDELSKKKKSPVINLRKRQAQTEMKSDDEDVRYKLAPRRVTRRSKPTVTNT